MRFNDLVWPILLTLFITSSLWAQAKDQDHDQDYTRKIYILDRTRSLLKGNLDSLANKVDSFFATERADDEFGRSTLRIRSNYEVRELHKGDSDISYRINFKIPSFEKRVREEAQKWWPKKETTSREETSNVEIPDHSRKDWYFNADAGVNASIPPRAILRARLRKNIFRNTWTHRFLEEVTYITESDGLTEVTSFTNDYPLAEKVLFRFMNSKSWKVLSRQLSTQHGPNIIHQLSPRDGLNYSLMATSVINEEGPWFLDNYRLSVRYRRDLYQQWLYFDLNTGLDFPKTYSFRRNPFAIFQLEALFGS